MLFFDQGHANLFFALFRSPKEGEDVASVCEEFSDKKKAFIDGVKQNKRAQATKHAWRKYKGKYKIALDRASRRSDFKGIVQRVKDSLDKAKKKKVGECIQFELRPFSEFEVLGALSELKSFIQTTAAYFCLEEEYANLAVVVEEITENLNEFEDCLVAGSPIPIEVFEALLVFVASEFFSESELSNLKDDQPIFDLYFQRKKKV